MNQQRHLLLVVDDEEANLQKLVRTLRPDYPVQQASSGKQALELLEKHAISAVITDQRMPGMSGVDLLRASLKIRPDVVRIILTGYTDAEDIINAINEGHVHRYITKPWDPHSLKQMVDQELRRWDLERENDRLAAELKVANGRLAEENQLLREEVRLLSQGADTFICRSQSMQDLISMVDRVVQTDSTVLIQGETGTGKEVLARYVHRNSQRADEAFIPVNCGAVPPDLTESAFFGHRKGSFTGATEDRKGYFELADKGTLFLDEIGESPLDLQVKLLRVLEDGMIMPVGAQSSRKIQVRVIASTNRNLSQMVEEGSFRQDLFFRLNVFSVFIPPLRARPDDIEALAAHFLERAEQRVNKALQGFSTPTLDLLLNYSWPGNVRELENEIERLAILSEPNSTIQRSLVAERIRFSRSRATRTLLKEQLADLERRLILEALKKCEFNKSRAADSLGITRQTIISKLKIYEANRKSIQQ